MCRLSTIIATILLTAIFGSTTVLSRERKPSAVKSFRVYPRGSSAFMVTWKKPLHPNDQIIGYKIIFKEFPFNYRSQPRMYSLDPHVTHIKEDWLNPNTEYSISILATNNMGDGHERFIYKRTLSEVNELPAKPRLTWEWLPLTNRIRKLRINWKPSTGRRSGSHFYTKYQIRGQSNFIRMDDEKINDYQDIIGLEEDTLYLFYVVSVDGPFETPSDAVIIDTGFMDPTQSPIDTLKEASMSKGIPAWAVNPITFALCVLALFIA